MKGIEMTTKQRTRSKAFRALADYIHGQIAGQGPLAPQDVSSLCGVTPLRARKVMESHPELFLLECDVPPRWSARRSSGDELITSESREDGRDVLLTIAGHLVSQCWMRVNLTPSLRKVAKHSGSRLALGTVEQLLAGLREHNRFDAHEVEDHLVRAVRSCSYFDVGSLLQGAVAGDWRSMHEASGIEGRGESAFVRLTRELDMLTMRSQGATLDEIGRAFGLTRERVRQLLAEHEALIEAQRARSALEASRDLRIEVAEVIAQSPGVSRKVLCARVGAPWSDISAAIPIRWVKFLGAEVRDQKLRWTETEILAALQTAAGHETPLSRKTFDRLVGEGVVDCCSTVRIAQVFGKWSRACEMAGVEPVRSWIDVYQRQWTEADCLGWICEFLLSDEVSRSIGCYSEWSRLQEGEAPSAGTILSMVGQWSIAVNRALIELRSDEYSERHAFLVRREAVDESIGGRGTLLVNTFLPSERSSSNSCDGDPTSGETSWI